MEFDSQGRPLNIERSEGTQTFQEMFKRVKLERKKQKWKSINEQTKPWTNNGEAYTDKEFRIVMDGDSEDEKDIIKIGKRFKRKATAIRELRKFRNRYLDTDEIPQCFWGQSRSNGAHDLPNKIDHQGQQLKRIIDEMPDYYRNFT